MNDIIELFETRLLTLSQLIDQASSHFGSDDFLRLRLIDDMFPLATQIAFTCNQPHNFVQWLRGEEVTNLDPEIATVGEAQQLMSTIRSALASIDTDTAELPAGKRLDFGPERYVEFSGRERAAGSREPTQVPEVACQRTCAASAHDGLGLDDSGTPSRWRSSGR